MIIDRRHLLRVGGAAVIAAGEPPHSQAQAPRDSDPQGTPPQPAGTGLNEVPDHTIRIGTSLLELGSDTTISTTLYYGQFPGPLLRLTEGKRVVIDIHNDTDTPEQLHWHGQFVPADVDGAAEEGTPFISAHGMRRIAFTPRPAGLRFYHSHLTAGAHLSLGLYSGQIGLVYIEPRREPGAYDREVFLTLKEFGPYLSRTEMTLDFLAPTATIPELEASQKAAMLDALKAGRQQGYEPAYNFFAINGRTLGQGEPIRVKAGERVLFHVLNASASKWSDASLLLRDLGTAFRGEALSYKPYPCGRPLHAAIDAALAARAQLEIERPDQIESVTIEADPAGHKDQFGSGPAKRRPTRVVEAQFAQPFLVATALVYGKIGIAEVDGLGDSSVLALPS